MSIEVALSKLRSAQICHPNAVQFLIDEAITAIQQAEVTNELLHPEDFNVEVVMKPVVGFAPVSTQGVRVTHKPTGISVTCDAARSQHTNRHHAFEQLRAILAQQPATGEPFGWWFTEDPDMFCMPGSGFSPFPNKPQHTSECIALYTHPSPGVPDAVVRDAERYRWLRSLEHCNEAWCFIGSGNANSNLDAAIDAAMLTAAQAQKGQP